MRNTLRSLLYGTTILAGLAAFVDGAPAQDNRPHAVGLRAGMPVSGSVLGGSVRNKRKAFVAMRGSNLRSLTVSPTTSLDNGVSERLRRSISRRHLTIPTFSQAQSDQAHPGQVHPGQIQKPPRTSRDLRRLYAFTPPIQFPAADLGFTPAGRKIEALRNVLGLEPIPAVEGAGPAPGPSTGGNPPSDAPGAAGMVDSGSSAGSTDPAGDASVPPRKGCRTHEAVPKPVRGVAFRRLASMRCCGISPKMPAGLQACAPIRSAMKAAFGMAGLAKVMRRTLSRARAG